VVLCTTITCWLMVRKCLRGPRLEGMPTYHQIKACPPSYPSPTSETFCQYLRCLHLENHHGLSDALSLSSWTLSFFLLYFLFTLIPRGCWCYGQAHGPVQYTLPRDKIRCERGKERRGRKGKKEKRKENRKEKGEWLAPCIKITGGKH